MPAGQPLVASRLAPVNPPLTSSDAAPRDDRAATASERPGVLIVEDDFLIGLAAENALIDAGFRVIGVAVSAEEAIAVARLERPVVAVMDIRLASPRDGVEAAGDLFREFGVRCVFATAHDDRQTRARAEPFAPLGWLSKPYTMASLVALVRLGAAQRD